MPESFIQTERPASTSSQGYLFGVILIAIVLLAGLIFFFRNVFAEKKTTDASILKNELFLNEDLVYNDNTPGAKNWQWEFGDGNSSSQQSGTYHYARSGSYIIRLTIDGNWKVQFPVMVKDTVAAAVDTALSINGPTAGVVNEEVRLEAVGKGTQFEWAFGETGRVDVTGRTALYTFRTAGKFLVKLVSDKSNPVTRVLYITDPSLDTVLVVPGEGQRKIVDDIRAHLQAIADGEDFNSNYYYLTSTYLCNNEKVKVAVEQDSAKSSTDFYRYCMGLTFGGEINVDQAQLTVSAKSACATLLNIKQHSARTANKN
jgi:hypothetical protein